MKDYLGSGQSGVYFILNNDIDCSSVTSWTCIGTSSSPFYAHLDGNSKTIKNLTFSTSSSKSGFYGTMANAGSIKNCTFDNINYTSTNGNSGIICGYITSASSPVTMTNVILQNSMVSAGDEYEVGGFVGHADSGLTCTNCLCKNVTISSTGGLDSAVGGFVGSNRSSNTFNGCTVDSCKMELTQTAGSAGGFVGFSLASITFDSDCSCKNSIIKNAGSDNGGFIGFAWANSNIKVSEGASKGDGAKVENCYIISQYGGVGGFVGCLYSSHVTCEIDGAVVSGCTIKGDDMIAGVIGDGGSTSIGVVKYPTVINCTITATSGEASGVVGAWS